MGNMPFYGDVSMLRRDTLWVFRLLSLIHI